MKILSKETSSKRRRKIGLNEVENMFHHALTLGNHLSDEDPLTEIGSGKEEDTHARGNSSDSYSRDKMDRTVPQLIKLKHRGLKIRAALPDNANKNYADDEDPISRM